MLSICIHHGSGYARQQHYNLSCPGDTARKMVWHYYAKMSLITLWASTVFSLKINYKSNTLKITSFFHYNLCVLFTWKFLNLAHSFGRFLLLTWGACPELSFSYLLTPVLRIP